MTIKYSPNQIIKTIWDRFLDEKKNVTYDFSSVHVKLPSDISNKIIRWSETKIKDKDLFQSEGRENEIHVTILYGIHDEEHHYVKKLLEQEPPVNLELGETNVFTNNIKFDVLKISVISPDLRRLNKKLKESLEFTNGYVKYQAHCTIAYMQKGTAKPYIGGEMFKGKKLKTDQIIFSSSNGKKTKIKLRGAPKL